MGSEEVCSSSPDPIPIQEIQPAPQQMQDQIKPQAEEIEELDLARPGESQRPIFISKGLSQELKAPVIELLKEYRDVFAWAYDEMPGLDPSLVVHRLNIAPGTTSIKQGQRLFRLEVEVQIK